MSMLNDIDHVLVSEESIKEINKKLGEQITKDYAGKKLLLVSILKGAVVFLADLMREIKIHCNIDFMVVSSYGAGTKTSGCINLHLDIKRSDYEKADIILVEDIVDSGRTLAMLTGLFRERHAHSVKCCTMLDKPSRREVDFQPDYKGLEIPDKFVVGYGLDYNEYYRDLPYVGVLRHEVYSK